MARNAHLLKCSHARRTGENLSPDAFCIHCFRSLGASRTRTQRAKVEAKHMCAEKLLSWQPAAPPPYN